MYKAVVVGCGGRAPAHIEAYNSIENAKVIACCAPTPRNREPLAEKYKIKTYEDAREMIIKEKPDIVHLITWPDLRVELMSLVSDLGVPMCTVEKPIASDVDDWKALKRLEETSDTKFAISHQLRWQPNFVKCRKAVESGRIGDIKILHISAGMNITGQGTHTLNYGMSLNNDSPVVRVFANASGWDTSDVGHPAPSTTEACLVFENGVNALWTSGSISPKCGDPDTTYQHVRIAAYAERGSVLFEEFGKWMIADPYGTESGDFGGMDSWHNNNVIAQTGFHKALINWHENNELPGTNLKQSLHEWSVVLALYQSALERRIIEMDSFNPPDDLLDRVKSVLG
jgi:predicted dehydrogenase